MSLNPLVVALSEAVTQDSRPLMAIIGLEPLYWEVPAFPATLTPCVTVIAEDGSDEKPVLQAGRMITYKAKVSDPTGRVVYSWEQRVETPPSVEADPEGSRRMQLTLQMVFEAPTPGIYTAQLTVAPDGDEELLISRTFRIRQLQRPAI